MTETGFTRVASLVAVVGATVAAVGPVVLSAPTAFRWSVVGASLLAVVFAAYSAYTLVVQRAHRPAAGLLATVLGAWLILAPVVYDVGGAVTGVVQAGGLLLTAFAGYVTLDTLLPPKAGYTA